MNEMLVFIGLFILCHLVAYVVAGALSYKMHKENYYDGNDPFYRGFRATGTSEWSHTGRWLLPTQVLRGFLMSLVLIPLYGVLGDLNTLPLFTFFFGLMYIYSELSSMVAGPCNIEGWLYLKKESFSKPKKFFCVKMQFEGVLYSLLFALLLTLLAF
ncbi:hypothetical protein [Methanonatronarchaeum sp. AMET6-2]|uniref:hypothetical protein n=1 Tax=Methanonatronarchaeum sp. AMET6-2 TaxID=2933293 RepID=UPI001FF12429|nr:hypothetical protein [Methanonatronarchaeum sp. AMET6-2]UOY09978.1 hypothetical protein MU439_06890 [Methanonatronarchaeum sp. AMET6-2]